MTETIAIDRSLSDKRLEAGDLVSRALSVIVAGELEAALGDVLEAMTIHQTTPVSVNSLAMAHAMLSWIAGRSGEIDEAEQHGRTSLELSQSHKLQICEILALRALGHAALSRIVRRGSRALSAGIPAHFPISDVPGSWFRSFGGCDCRSISWRRASIGTPPWGSPGIVEPARHLGNRDHDTGNLERLLRAH
jgi:hypothetical protein